MYEKYVLQIKYAMLIHPYHHLINPRSYHPYSPPYPLKVTVRNRFNGQLMVRHSINLLEKIKNIHEDLVIPLPPLAPQGSGYL